MFLIGPPWAIKLRHCPTVAYSGEIDKQKQAADVMEAACKQAGMKLTHIIGPQTAHKIHPDSAIEITRLGARGRGCGLQKTFPFHGQVGLGERENERAVLGRLFDEFNAAFRFTLIDAGGAADVFAKTAGRNCDAAYLIVQLGTTNTAAARTALGALYSEGARVLGCVVTNCV